MFPDANTQSSSFSSFSYLMSKSTSMHLLYSTYNMLRNLLCYFIKHIIITKRPISASLITPKPLIVWITIDCGKFSKRWEYQTAWPASWEICMQIKEQHLELDIEQQTGSKSGKEYAKAVYCHPDYLIYIQSTSCEMLGWMKQKLESRFQGQLSINSDMKMTPPLWQKAKKN